MKVIHLACIAPPETGGIGMVAWREVSGLRSRGIDAELIAPEPKGGVGQEDERRFVTRLVPKWRLGNASALPLNFDVLKKADVIHVHWPFFGSAEQVLARAKELPPIVVTFHMDAHAGGVKGLAFAWHRLFIQPFLLPQAVRILVSSFDYARHSSLKRVFACDPKRVLELPFGVDTDAYAPGPSARVRFGVPEHAPVVAFVGGMDSAHAFKGIPELLSALTQAPSFHALLIGDGNLRATFETQAQTQQLRKRVHFLGKTDDQTKIDVLRTADVFALPSTRPAEAFGLVAVEALACGVPVVASDLPGVRTVVDAGKTGWLVRPGSVTELVSALEKTVENPSRHREMSAAARARAVERFSADRHLDDLVQVYRLVCASRS